MSLTTIEVADAVVSTINAAPQGTFAPAFVATRQVLPVFSLEDLATLRVTVVPAGIEIGVATRQSVQRDHRIDIGVQARVSDDDTDVAALVALVDSIVQYLYRATISIARVLRVEIDPLYAREHLAEERTFTSVIRLTYRELNGW